jgi:hypothetical protein
MLLNIPKAKDIVSTNLLESYSSYIHELQQSIFCLCPPKTTLWSFRLFESIAAGCLPVLFDEGEQRLPFEDIIDYNKFITRIHRDDAIHTADILRSISAKQVAAKQQELHKVRDYVSLEKWGFHLLLYEMYKRQRGLNETALALPVDETPHYAHLSKSPAPTTSPTIEPVQWTRVPRMVVFQSHALRSSKVQAANAHGRPTKAEIADFAAKMKDLTASTHGGALKSVAAPESALPAALDSRSVEIMSQVAEMIEHDSKLSPGRAKLVAREAVKQMAKDKELIKAAQMQAKMQQEAEKQASLPADALVPSVNAQKAQTVSATVSAP